MYDGFIKQLVSSSSNFQGQSSVGFGALRSISAPPNLTANPVLNFDHLPPSLYLRERYGITPRESYVQAHGGVKLRVVRFEPRITPFFTTLIAPGQNDPIENHARFAFMLARLGVRVFVYDPRSQGYSGRTAGLQHIDTRHKFDHLRDLQRVVNEVVRPRLTETRSGRLGMVGFSMGALHMLVGLARGDFAADHAVAVAPAIKPLDLPLDNFEGFYTSLWIRGTREFKGKEHIRPPEGWDFSRVPLSAEFYHTNPYTNDKQQLDLVWKRMQLDGDMLRYGWPTKARVADMYRLRRIMLALPTGSIKTPLILVNPEYDSVVCNRASEYFCLKTAEDLRDIVELPVRHAVNLAGDHYLQRLVAISTGLAAPQRCPWKRPAHALASLQNAA